MNPLKASVFVVSRFHHARYREMMRGEWNLLIMFARTNGVDVARGLASCEKQQRVVTGNKYFYMEVTFGTECNPRLAATFFRLQG